MRSEPCKGKIKCKNKFKKAGWKNKRIQIYSDMPTEENYTQWKFYVKKIPRKLLIKDEETVSKEIKGLSKLWEICGVFSTEKHNPV